MSSQQQRRDALRVADEAALAARRRLVAAFRAAADQDAPRPSVTAICRDAGVARSTFYTHFSTVDDLALASIGDLFASASAADVAGRLGDSPDRPAITRAGLGLVVDALEASSTLLGYAVRIGSRALVLELLVEQFAAYTRETIDTEYGHLDEAQRILVDEYISAGVAHALMRWIADPAGIDREALLDLLVELLPAWITR